MTGFAVGTRDGAWPRPKRSAGRPAEGLTQDDELIDACKRREAKAWNELMRLYEPAVFRFAYRLAGNRDDAEDVVSIVFLRLYDRLQTFRPGSCFLAWLFRIVRNTYIDCFVRCDRSKNHLSLCTSHDGEELPARDVIDPAPTPLSHVINQQRNTVLSTAIRHLPGNQRSLVNMYYTDGWSYMEIAERTGLCIGTVKSRLFRARQNLRDRLQPYQELL